MKTPNAETVFAQVDELAATVSAIDAAHGASPKAWTDAGFSRRQADLIRNFVGAFRSERLEPADRR